MNPSEDAKAAKERTIFEAFVQCEGAPPVDASSIESRRPPEPDILCTVAGRGPTAFELVEIVEGEWAKLISNLIRLDKSLYLEHERFGQPLVDAYADALIYVRCLPEAPIKQREKLIPALFDFLTKLPRGIEGDAKPEGDLAKTVRSVRITRGDFGPGPFFQVEGVKSIGDPTAESIQGKWIKNYETRRPTSGEFPSFFSSVSVRFALDHLGSHCAKLRLELLAYYNWHPTVPESFWIGHIQSFVETNWATSPFQKVWICDPASKKILFAADKSRRGEQP